jgi:hypothetical protein
MRGGDFGFGVVAPDIAVAEIIGKNEKNVGMSHKIKTIGVFNG